MAAVTDPSLLDAVYVLPPDYEIMTETAEVFTKALLLGLEPDTGQADFADMEPVEILPYEEALAYMRKRLPIDADTYYALGDKMRYRAFTVGRLADGDAVQHVQQMLVKALDEGTGLQQFLQMTEGELANAAGMGRGAGWYYETVYRTNMATSYNAGRAIGFEETPPIALELIGIDDARQTELCHSLTAPPFRRPYDDPVWEHLWPPFHFNCRTTIRAIYDEAEIDDAGGPDKFYSKDAPDYKPDKGFGTYPVDKTDTWWDMTEAMKERAEEYRLEAEFLEAKGQLVDGEPDPQRAAETKAAEDYAQNTLGLDHADYSGIDPAVAHEWNTHLERTLREYPELKDQLRFTGSAEAQNELLEKALETIHLEIAKLENPALPQSMIRSIALDGMDKDMKKLAIPENMISRSISPLHKDLQQYGGISINPSYTKDIATLVKQLESDVAGGLRPWGAGSIKAAYDHEVAHQLDHLLGLRKDSDMLFLWNSYTREAKVAGLSEYGSRKIEDFIAEGWAEFTNNPSPRPLSAKIGSLIVEKYALWKR